ncbi:MAG: nitroreductase family protein [Candidatus Diapherotrites archaeon]|nr:nitroreductase family protein [Candidatus Diapherotrites archaeon]
MEKDVPDKLITELIDCAIHAPSSCNTQPWEFIIIRNKETKEKLSEAHRWCSFIKDAPVVIVVCFDSNKLNLSPSNIATTSVAAENILLAANSLGLGTCWVYIKDYNEPEIEQKVKNTLSIPEHINALCMIPVGYPASKPTSKKLTEIEEIIHFEKW